MSGKPLQGLGVLVTRPREQAAGLIQAIESQGGQAIAFPVIEILPSQDPSLMDDLKARLPETDLLIFISANAVRHSGLTGADFLNHRPGIACLGKATAAALREQGIDPDLVPESGYNTDALLALHRLQDLQGKQVTILRGQGGREALAEGLRTRGAEVRYAEVYQRKCPETDPTALLKQWREGRIDVVTATSNESLQNLHELLGHAGRDLLTRIALVVIGPRMLKLAQQLGWTGTLIPADSAHNEAIRDALLQWRKAPS